MLLVTKELDIIKGEIKDDAPHISKEEIKRDIKNLQFSKIYASGVY